MKTVVALAIFCGVFCALAQAKPQNTAVVKHNCTVEAFTDAVEAYIEDTFELVNDIAKIQETAVEQGLECAKDLTDSQALVSCICTTVIDWVNTLMPTVQQFIIKIVTVSEALANDIYDCI